MIPKLEIRISLPYNLILSDDFNYEKYLRDYDKSIDEFKTNFEKFENQTLEFEIFFNKNKNKILKLIEKYSGFLWKKEHVVIYLVNMTKKPSIADPLTLKFNPDIDSMGILLIHELTHLNLPIKMQMNTENKICEQWVNLITRKVAEDLSLNLIKAPMKNFSEALELDYDLTKKTLKSYLKL